MSLSLISSLKIIIKPIHIPYNLIYSHHCLKSKLAPLYTHLLSKNWINLMSTFLMHAVLAVSLTGRWKIIRFLLNVIVVAILYPFYYNSYNFESLLLLHRTCSMMNTECFFSAFFSITFLSTLTLLRIPLDPNFINKGQTTLNCTRLSFIHYSR